MLQSFQKDVVLHGQDDPRAESIVEPLRLALCRNLARAVVTDT